MSHNTHKYCEGCEHAFINAEGRSYRATVHNNDRCKELCRKKRTCKECHSKGVMMIDGFVTQYCGLSRKCKIQALEEVIFHASRKAKILSELQAKTKNDLKKALDKNHELRNGNGKRLRELESDNRIKDDIIDTLNDIHDNDLKKIKMLETQLSQQYSHNQVLSSYLSQNIIYHPPTTNHWQAQHMYPQQQAPNPPVVNLGPPQDFPISEHLPELK